MKWLPKAQRYIVDNLAILYVFEIQEVGHTEVGADIQGGRHTGGPVINRGQTYRGGNRPTVLSSFLCYDINLSPHNL